MTKDEALRLALEVLTDALNKPMWNRVQMEAAITAIKAALEAKDEPEYYGLTKDHLWMSISKEHYDRLKPEFRMTCYTTPPQRKPLRYEEIEAIAKEHIAVGTRSFQEFARRIESAHGIKGEA